jgi:hypothetical protein
MNKIASPQELTVELRKLLNMAEGANPSRMELAEALRSLAERVEKEPSPAAAPSVKHALKVGDILECSWGYDQTNLDYYLVTKLLGVAMVEIREIGKKSVGEDMTTNKVMPDPAHVIGAPLRKKVGPSGAVRLTSYSSAYPWDKKPGWETKSEFGH